MATIAFIGLGNMGGPMAANLVKAGHKVQGFDLVQASKDAAKADGVSIAASAADVVKGVEIVITMLPAGRQVTPGELFSAETIRHAANLPDGLQSVRNGLDLGLEPQIRGGDD